MILARMQKWDIFGTRRRRSRHRDAQRARAGRKEWAISDVCAEEVVLLLPVRALKFPVFQRGRFVRPALPASCRVLAFRIVNPTIVRPSLRIRVSSSSSMVFVAPCGLRKLM